MLAYTWVILKCKLVGARDINLLYVKLCNLLLGKIYDFSLFYMTWITMYSFPNVTRISLLLAMPTNIMVGNRKTLFCSLRKVMQIKKTSVNRKH